MRTPFPLGRVVEHDPRSLSFPAPTAPVVTKSWTHYGEVLDQGQVGSCTGNAMAQAVNTKPVHKPRTAYLTEADAVALYSRATVLDGFAGTYPPDDTGSSGLAVAKAAQERGLITSYTHAFGLDHALQALMSGPVIVGTPWYDDMFHPGPQGFLHIGGNVAGGHEWLVLGVNVTHKYVTALNSWGPSWGVRGRFRLTFDDFGRLLSEQGDVVQPVRQANTGAVREPWLA